MELLSVIVLINLIGLSIEATSWSYDYETQWPGICTSGRLQSPINIMTSDTVLDLHGVQIRGPLNLQGYHRVTLTAENNGHTLKWNKAHGTPAPILSGGPVRGNYTFLQFHLHWLSEHAIDAKKYALEIHMVHVKSGISLEEALTRPDGLAVIGVLAEVGSEESSKFPLEQLMEDVPQILEKTTEQTKPREIEISRLFSVDPDSYYTYHGSLTTPYCQEVVTWIVMNKPIRISDKQYKEISRANVGRIVNYRRLQSSDDRIVYRSKASCSSMLAPSTFSTLIGLISCLTTTLSAGVSKSICWINNIKTRLFGKAIKDCAKLN